MTDLMDIDNIPDIENLIEDSTVTETKKAEEKKLVTRKTLDLYYRYAFPFSSFFKWLGKNDSDYFEKREICFTLENDIYCRFLCFKNDEEFKKEVLRSCPFKIDIGAVYNTPPKHHNSVMSSGNTKGFLPQQKELVFDIDMTDYDEVRTCCKEANICNKCWQFMVIAYRILNSILREDFGFEKIMWIFSGRRGIHCWVSDDRARALTNEGRSSISNYIKIKTMNTKTGSGVQMKNPVHPSLLRSIDIIEKSFEDIALRSQEILLNSSIQELLEIYIKAYFYHKKAIQTILDSVKKIFSDRRFATSKQKWDEIETLLSKENDEENEKTKKIPKKYTNFTKSQLCLKDFKLCILFPRLDINVSKHINHLLKSPFCVHPKTGLISVPLSEDDIINFDITKVPSLEDVIEGLNNTNGGGLGKYEKFLKNFNA